MKHGLVIADASGARIFVITGLNHPLELLREMSNPDGRARNQDLVTAESGRVSKSGAPGTRSAVEPRNRAHDEAAIEFAHRLAKSLHDDLHAESFAAVSLVAPPHFLGTLRPLLEKAIGAKLHATVAKDLVHVPTHDLRPHLDEILTAVNLN